ncbi:MAG: hypothetical protein WCG66_05565 [bacterium]
MRGFLLVLIACSAQVSAGDTGSAILALRAATASPSGAHATIVELTGDKAAPAPAEWKIVLADPSARGGVRELTVANGTITAERTPLKGFHSVSEMPPLRPSEVLVDVPSLFQTVNRQAKDAHAAFDMLDYNLRTDNSTGKPVWTVRLYDHLGSPVGTMAVSAQGGSVVQNLQMPDGLPLQTHNRKKVGGLVGKIRDFFESTTRKIGDTTLRAIGTAQEFLVGERTIGPQGDE